MGFIRALKAKKDNTDAEMILKAVGELAAVHTCARRADEIAAQVSFGLCCDPNAP